MSRWPHRTLVSVPRLGVAEDLAADVRHAVLGSLHAAAAPCDMRKVCQAGGFREIRTKFERSSQHRALLFPNSDGTFDILVDASRPGASSNANECRRFLLAHEVGHSFFYNRRTKPASRSLSSSPEEEHFCNTFARALLVPPAETAKLAPSPDAIYILCRRYVVSAELASRALAQVYPHIYVVLMKKKRQATTPSRIGMSIGPQPLSPDARLRSRTVDRAQETGSAEDVEDLSVGDLQGRFSVKAAVAPSRKQMVVVLSSL